MTSDGALKCPAGEVSSESCKGACKQDLEGLAVIKSSPPAGGDKGRGYFANRSPSIQAVDLLPKLPKLMFARCPPSPTQLPAARSISAGELLLSEAALAISL